MTTQLIEPATVHLPPLPQLNAGERAALETYCAELLRALSREHVKSVILYGSKARGDAHPDSD
ncbi:MAG: nucleotidyltransferase domain-containing protein, partial [Chloroflexota bacterium]